MSDIFSLSVEDLRVPYIKRTLIGITTNEGLPFCAIHSIVLLQVLWKLVATFDIFTALSHPRAFTNSSDGVQHTPKLQPFNRSVFICLFWQA